MSVGPGRGVLKCHGRDEPQLGSTPHLTSQLLTPPAAWGTCRGEHSVLYCMQYTNTGFCWSEEESVPSNLSMCIELLQPFKHSSILIHSFCSHLIHSMHYA